jgi:CubicO group peptidase (beta-lactamase class C family)
MKKYKSILFTFIFAANFFTSNAQQQTDSISQKLDEYLLSANKFYKFNGGILVAEKGEIILEKAYGWKNVAAKTLNDTNTIFQIGSNTKPFTATTILKLQEEGKLSVNDKLTKYFPAYKYADKITIENLLTHTSGIPGYNVDETDTVAWTPVSKETIFNLFKDQPLEFEPGTKYKYSNSGYFLLGQIIEKVTGKPYEEAVREMIFEPLQMDHSGFDFIYLHDTLKATGYAVLNDKEQRPVHLIDSTVSYAAGAMYSTLGDMYKWAKAIADKKILSADSWAKALTPFKENYGYGWIIDSINGEKYVGHSGGIMGFTSYLVYFPNEGVTIILLNNFLDENDAVILPVQDLSAIIFNKPYKLVSAVKEIKINDSLLNKYVGTYALSSAPKRTIVVSKDNSALQANLSGKITTPIIFQTTTKFEFKNVPNTDGEFIIENGKVIKLVISQNGLFEWNKIK